MFYCYYYYFIIICYYYFIPELLGEDGWTELLYISRSLYPTPVNWNRWTHPVSRPASLSHATTQCLSMQKTERKSALRRRSEWRRVCTHPHFLRDLTQTCVTPVAALMCQTHLFIAEESKDLLTGGDDCASKPLTNIFRPVWFYLLSCGDASFK